MTWSDNWNDVRPVRAYWHTANQQCYDEGLGGWGGSATRDDASNTNACGPGNWHSNNNANGDGNAVKRIQDRINRAFNGLRSYGHTTPANLTVDGVYGTNTRTAVKWYQQHVGFTGTAVDGLVGLNTWNYLKGPVIKP